MKCHEVMTRDPQFCTADQTCAMVAQVLCDADIGSVPVVDSPTSRRVLGMITDRDICCRLVAGEMAPDTAVERIMTRGAACCREEDPIDEVERVMEECQIRRVPILDAQGRLVGIVTQADMARREPRRAGRVVEAISRPSPGASSFQAAPA